MKRILKLALAALTTLLVVSLLFIGTNHLLGNDTDQAATLASSKLADKKVPSPKAEKKKAKANDKKNHYPDLSNYDQLRVEVSIDNQTMQIFSKDKEIFKTSVSTGKPSSPTPKGDFVIEPERGDFFYNPTSKEGAYYWVSFKDHGVYLFHSLSTDQNGKEIPEEADKLGQAASHGCVRMPKETAKWFYENIPVHTPVHIY